MNDIENKNPIAKIFIAIGFLSSWTGIAGIVDGLIKWRKFFANFIEYYKHVRSFIAEMLPFHLPAWMVDYLIIGAGFVVIGRVVSDTIIGSMYKDSDVGVIRAIEKIEKIKRRLGHFKYRYAVCVRILRNVYQIGPKRLYRFVVDKVEAVVGMKPTFFTWLWLIIFHFPFTNILLWPITMLSFRWFFGALYGSERRFSVNTFLYFWGGLIVIAFLVVDVGNTFKN